MVRLPEYVVFDLETNADVPNPSEHEVIQIGAVLDAGDGALKNFETLVRPRRRLPARITEVTGLEYGDLEHAPPLEDALQAFLDWVGDRPLIAPQRVRLRLPSTRCSCRELQSPRAERATTRHAGASPLSCIPRAGKGMVRGVDGARPPPGRNLDQLAVLVGLAARDKHDALEDARITREVMVGLLREMNASDPARHLQRWILGRAGHPWSAFLDPVNEPVRLDGVVADTEAPPNPVKPTGSLNVSALIESFGEGGSLMTNGRTPRPQQAEMAELAATAFAAPGRRLMIEAPTGTGKTLAYLVPAIEAGPSIGSGDRDRRRTRASCRTK